MPFLPQATSSHVTLATVESFVSTKNAKSRMRKPSVPGSCQIPFLLQATSNNGTQATVESLVSTKKRKVPDAKAKRQRDSEGRKERSFGATPLGDRYILTPNPIGA